MGGTSGVGTLSRPVLLPLVDGGVRIAAPLHQTPLAYVSMARRHVFVDRAFRDRASFSLRVHISVSTGLWRIPLPGDPPGEPITPGDELREFEEWDIARWDPDMEPAEGDIRLVQGRSRPLRIDFDCAPARDGAEWYSGGPWTVLRCDGSGETACREDFAEVGVGTRRPRRGCADQGRPARFLTWQRLDAS